MMGYNDPSVYCDDCGIRIYAIQSREIGLCSPCHFARRELYGRRSPRCKVARRSVGFPPRRSGVGA